jgi:L-ascorbate metabolism protein UlaG (beta-lactamase superfamily)
MLMPFWLKAKSYLNMTKQKNSIRLLRHATLIIQFDNFSVMVDPMLSSKNEMDPVQNCGNETRIPMTDLPIRKGELETVLNEVDAIAVTHIHRDHWDGAAQKLISKEKLILCQPADEGKIREQGFVNVMTINDQATIKGIVISRTNGQHGTGEIGKKMGTVSGFVLSNRQLSIYIAGDTTYCDDVEAALKKHKPDVTILNAGGAQFLTGGPITMTPVDIKKVSEALPTTRIIAVHMDTVNHCFIKRSDLQKSLSEMQLQKKVAIPVDGEFIEI